MLRVVETGVQTQTHKKQAQEMGVTRETSHSRKNYGLGVVLASLLDVEEGR